MEHPVCKHCGSDVNWVDRSVGAHMLCHVRAKHGSPTPSLGVRCPACDGTGLCFIISSAANVNVNVMGLSARQFDNLMDALHCKECNQSGVVV